MPNYNYEIESLIDDVKEEHNYLSETKKEVLNNVKGNYPQLCTYESEWIYFDETGYIPGEPVGLEYQTVEGTNCIVKNAIPYKYKSAILKGKTLVNNLKEITLPVQSTSADNIDIPIIIKINKGDRYYAYVDIEVPSGTTRNLIGFLGNAGWQSYAPTLKSGINKVALDAKSDLTESLRIQTDKGTILKSVVLMRENVEFINQFWGMKSVQMPVLKIVGKNLFDKNLVVPGRLDNGQLGYTTDSTVTIFDDGFEVVSMSKYRGCVIEKIKINGSSEYYLSYNINPITEGFSVNFHFLDKDYNYISKVSAYIGDDNGISTPSNAAYVSLWFNTNKTTDTPITLQNIQFEEDNNATEYEPFQSNILTVNEVVTLRSNGDVYDELNLLTGRLTQRIDENNEVLAQAVVKTVDLTPISHPFEGVNNFTTSSDTIPPYMILQVPVVSSGEQTIQEINK